MLMAARISGAVPASNFPALHTSVTAKFARFVEFLHFAFAVKFSFVTRFAGIKQPRPSRSSCCRRSRVFSGKRDVITSRIIFASQSATGGNFFFDCDPAACTRDLIFHATRFTIPCLSPLKCCTAPTEASLRVADPRPMRILHLICLCAQPLDPALCNSLILSIA
jgi:hypothetical protein